MYWRGQQSSVYSPGKPSKSNTPIFHTNLGPWSHRRTTNWYCWLRHHNCATFNSCLSKKRIIRARWNWLHSTIKAMVRCWNNNCKRFKVHRINKYGQFILNEFFLARKYLAVVDVWYLWVLDWNKRQKFTKVYCNSQVEKQIDKDGDFTILSSLSLHKLWTLR